MAKSKKSKGVGRNGNLIPAVKGEIRNAAGKPPGTRNRRTIILEALEMIAENGKAVADNMTLAQVVKALDGDTAAFKELMDSAYGKNTEPVKHSGEVSICPVTKILDEISEQEATLPSYRPAKKKN